MSPAVRWGLGLWVLVLLGCGASEQSAEGGLQPASALVREGLQHSDPMVRAETLRLLALRPGSDPAPLKAALTDGDLGVQLAAALPLLQQATDDAVRIVNVRMLEGGPDERRAMLRMLVEVAPTEARRVALSRGLRDTDALVRKEALRLALERNMGIGAQDLDRLRADTDPDVAALAFQHLLRLDRTRALDDVLRDLRDDDAERQRRALQRLPDLRAPELWPLLRALIRYGDPHEQRAAALALGHMGDPIVDELLRNIVLTADGPTAAAALRAMRSLPQERGRQQATVHVRDQRPELRAAALDVLIDTRAPSQAFQPFLSDDVASTATRALLHLQRVAPDAATAHLEEALAASDAPTSALRGLHGLASEHDLSRVLGALTPTLEAIARGEDAGAGWLAISLLARVLDLSQLLARFGDTENPGVRYALAERMLVDGVRDPARLAAWRQDEAFFLRLASALAMDESP